MLESLTTGSESLNSAPGQLRRPHKKSRAGCLPCKRRKVKCNEDRPYCKGCTSRGMTCTYPLAPSKSSTESTSESSGTSMPVRILPQPSILSNAPLQLTYMDLRFLHHFLTEAYPHLPAGNESIWLHEIPQIAESRTYLMHALLGLGGSHLAIMSTTPPEALSASHPPRISTNHSSSTTTPKSNTSSTSAVSRSPTSDIANRALHHRSTALSGLNHAITANDWSQSSVDAMLATAYALTFQATYLPHDGIIDFMTMVRGCALITGKIEENQARSTFALDPMAHVNVLEGKFNEGDRVGTDMMVGGDDFSNIVDREEWINEGLSALKGVQALCPNSNSPGAESTILQRNFSALIRTLEGLNISTREAYIRYAEIYTVWWMSEAAEFELLTSLFPPANPSKNALDDPEDTANALPPLLVLTFLTLDLLLTPIFATLYSTRRGAREALNRQRLVTIGWMRRLQTNLETRFPKPGEPPEEIGGVSLGGGEGREGIMWDGQGRLGLKVRMAEVEEERERVARVVRWAGGMGSGVERGILGRLRGG